MNDISQMNTTWDEICQTAMDSRSGEYGPTNELVIGRNTSESPARSVVLCHCGGTTQTWLRTLNWGHPHNWEGKWKHWKCENNMKVKPRYRLTRRLATTNNISIHNEITNVVIPIRPSPSVGEHYWPCRKLLLTCSQSAKIWLRVCHTMLVYDGVSKIRTEKII